MPSLLPRAVRRSAGDPSFSVFLVAVVLSLFRARDLPAVDLGASGTDVSIGPADLALAATAALAAVRLWHRRHVPAPGLLAAVAAFAGLLFLSSLRNGSEAVVAAGKLVELGALTLGTAAFVDTRRRFGALILTVVAFAVVAVSWGLIGFLSADRGRQASFMGEHDLAALATLALAVGLARLHQRRGRPEAVAVVALAAGLVGVVLGASLASLLGVYAVAVAVIAIAGRRGELRPAAVATTVVLALGATAGTLALRQGELGFIQSLFGPPEETPGEYASSWSQRLIYTYVGGRVFLDQPVLGTGWHGELPPAEFARYLPDARERFDNQPAHYFPAAEEDFIPQQTYDQVLFELGVVGAIAFVLAIALAARRAGRAVRRAWQDTAYVPTLWLAAIGGALAGAALFGGSPLTALFWLTLGVVAARPEKA